MGAVATYSPGADHERARCPVNSRRTDSVDLSATLARDVAARPWRSTLAAAVISLVGTTIAVAVADVLLAGFRVEYPGGAVAFAVVATAVTMLAQPFMVGGSVRLGWWGVLLVAVLGQAAVVGVTARVMPRVEVDGFWTAFALGWVIGAVATLCGGDELGHRRGLRQPAGP